MKMHTTISMLATALVLASCGGAGGGEEEEGAGSASVLGHFIDSEVDGLTYSVNGVERKTGYNADGQMMGGGSVQCTPGSTVEFKINGHSVGSAPCGDLYTPMSITGNVQAKYENLAYLLQNLDNDGNPSNGIAFDETKVGAISSAIDLNDDAAITTMVTTVGESVAKNAAITHLNDNAKKSKVYQGNFDVVQNYTCDNMTHTGKAVFTGAGLAFKADSFANQIISVSDSSSFGGSVTPSISPEHQATITSGSPLFYSIGPEADCADGVGVRISNASISADGSTFTANWAYTCSDSTTEFYDECYGTLTWTAQ